MLEDYIGLNLESLVDPSTLQQRTTTLIKRKWTKLIPRYKSEYLGNATEHPIANYEREFITKYGDEAESLKDDLAQFHNPLEALAHYTHKGMMPPPELLCSITEIFELYMARKGESNLEELMFGRPERENAPSMYSKRVANELNDAELYLRLGAKSENQTEEEITDNFLQEKYADRDPRDMPDTANILRQKRRILAKGLPDKAP